MIRTVHDGHATAARLPLLARLEGAIGRACGRLPPSTAVRLSGEPPVVIDGCTLDPHVQLLRALARRRHGHGLCEPTVPIARARYRADLLAARAAPTAVGAVHEVTLPGPDGTLAARHYVPPGHPAGAPLLLWFHGGGFVIGDLDSHDEPCRLLCRESGTHVLSVAYRLAPEHRFPAAVEDACAALAWAQANAATLGADAARVSVGGDSAGGTLAAVAARLATREGRPPLAQLLVYPATDSNTRRPSRELFAAGFFLTMHDHASFTRHYLGDRAQGADPLASPLLATDLHGLPPALVVTAGFDPLRDEGEAYAEALRGAGSTAITLRLPSMVHGFVHMTTLAPGAAQAMRTVATAWRALVDDTTRATRAGSSLIGATEGGA